MSRSPNRAPDRRRAGFTLIEVLIAFAILAVALTALMQAFALGLRSQQVSERYVVAALHARSKMAEVGVLIPLAEDELSGEFGGEFGGEVGGDYDWQLSIAPAAEELIDFGAITSLRLYEVRLSVGHEGDELLRLVTLRAGAAQ